MSLKRELVEDIYTAFIEGRDNDFVDLSRKAIRPINVAGSSNNGQELALAEIIAVRGSELGHHDVAEEAAKYLLEHGSAHTRQNTGKILGIMAEKNIGSVLNVLDKARMEKDVYAVAVAGDVLVGIVKGNDEVAHAAVSGFLKGWIKKGIKLEDGADIAVRVAAVLMDRYPEKSSELAEIAVSMSKDDNTHKQVYELFREMSRENIGSAFRGLESAIGNIDEESDIRPHMERLYEDLKHGRRGGSISLVAEILSPRADCGVIQSEPDMGNGEVSTMLSEMRSQVRLTFGKEHVHS